MDPVSLLTSIPDLIERCIQGYNFFRDVKNAPKACSELMEELDIARARLVELQEHVNRVEDREKVQLSVNNYKKTLDKLDSILKVYRDPKFNFNFVKRIKWVWSGEKKFKELCDDLKHNSGILQPLLVKIANDIDDMKKCQQEAAAKKVAKDLAKRLLNIVKWLEPLNSQAKLREVRERRQPETCEWLSSHDLFVSWYESSSSFLWLNGIPGNGKTVLASFVIDHLKQNVTDDEIVLFAFADFQVLRSTDVVVLLRTLLAQLLNHYKPEDIVNDHDFTELEKNMQQHPADPPKTLGHLVELLGKASAPWKRVFVVIDALDECTLPGRRESIVAIRKLASAGSKMSVFVTSRAEQNIVGVLSSVPTISLVYETSGVKDDIRIFIKEKMNTTYLPLARLHEPLRIRISSSLLEKANGMFRLVDCQLQSLAKAKFESDIDEILQNLPTDLNSMYEKILQGVEEEGQRAVKIVQHTLWWLVGSHRQLRLEEVMEAVMVEAGEDSPNTGLKPLSGEHLLEMCSSLVHYNAKTDILTLSHASVQDFLFSDYLKGRAHHRDYHIPSFSFLHRHITGLISTYLQYKDFRNGPCTAEQHLLERLRKHPFLVYVVSNWDLHIVKVYETCTELERSPDLDKVLTIFDSEKNLLAQRSRRQVSYFVKDPRDFMKHFSWGGDFGGSSGLEPEERTLNVFSSLIHESETNLVSQFSRGKVSYYGTDLSDAMESCEDIGGFVCPRYCAGPFWLWTDDRLIPNYPWRDLSNTTSLQELDYMIYPLVAKGSPSLVRDLLCRLDKFKDRPLFFFGTPLMISIFSGKLDTVTMLLDDLQVNVNACARHYHCNHEVVSPIFIATKYGHVEVVKQLLDRGSATGFHPGPRLKWLPGKEPEDEHGDIIIGAVDYGRADILKVLIHRGVDVNTRSRISGDTVLHAAIIYGSIDSVAILVNAGCDISPRSKGKTPLDLALNQRSSNLIRYLLAKGASFDQCLPHNFEDLSWASGEQWYQQAQEHLVGLKGGPNLQQDSDNDEVARPLMAGLWTVTSAERHERVEIMEYSPHEPYISTTLPVTGSPENPVRRIVFETVSHDQGWSTDRTHGGGMYSGSFTWFEAGVDSSPGVFMHVQDNVRADSQYRTHVNVWDHQDAPSSVKEWMANIKPGDTISVYPRARFAAWVNYVQSVKIDVYTARVQEEEAISETSL